MTPITSVRIENPQDILRVRQVAGAIAGAFALERFAQTRVVTACLELARNALQYGGGGRMTFAAASTSVAGKGALALAVSAIDEGPGIEDAQDVLSGDGPVAARGTSGGLGLGLGLGLRGVRRMASRFDCRTGSEGTRIDVAFETPLPSDAGEEAAGRAIDALAQLGKADPAAELARQNRDLAEALAERELLINEVHHRTGNNLALILGLIQMSRRSAESSETARVLGELEGRVHAVVKVHQELQRAENVDRILIVPFLQSVATHARQAFSSAERTIEIRAEGDRIYLASAAAIDVGLVVGELITNAFKHAFEERSDGRITVTMKRKKRAGPNDGGDKAFVLTVADNGVGLSPDQSRPERASSLGWRMIRAMVKRHDGTLVTKSEDGFAVVIEFPQAIAAQDR